MPPMAMGNSPFVPPGEEPTPADIAAEPTRKIADAKAFLVQALSEGPRPATEMLLAAAAAGIAEGTLYTAKRRLRVQSRRQGYDDGRWVWALPLQQTRLDRRFHPTASVGMS